MPREHGRAETRPLAALDAFENRTRVLELARQGIDLQALLQASRLQAGGDTVVVVRSAHCLGMPVSEGDKLASTSAARLANWLR
ncbi:hypothetical protein GCM10028794_18150 [Silanimonas algicola]